MTIIRLVLYQQKVYMKKKVFTLIGILLASSLLSTQAYAYRPGQNGGGWSPTPYNGGGWNGGGYRPYNGGGWGPRPYWNGGGCWNCGIGAGLAIGAGLGLVAGSLMSPPVMYQQPVIVQQPTYVMPTYPRVIYTQQPQVTIINTN